MDSLTRYLELMKKHPEFFRYSDEPGGIKIINNDKAHSCRTEENSRQTQKGKIIRLSGLVLGSGRRLMVL